MKTKKLLLLIMMLSITSISFGQIKGIDLSITFPEKMENYGTLNKSDDGSLAIHYKLTPVGLKKCFEKVRELLIANDKSFDDTILDKSIINSTVKDLYDYEQLHSTLSIGYSEIQMIWKIDDKPRGIILGCTDEVYMIYLKN